MDRSDVVKAWECCIDTENGPCAEECPMKDAEWKETGLAACRAFADDHVEVPLALVQRTVELLKAQEPRVMTLEEALNVDYAYLEIRIHKNLDTPCCILTIDEDGDIYPLKRGFSGFLHAESYGADWRC